MSLTVAFITAREKPEFSWFLDSLKKQGGDFRIIVVDSFAGERNITGIDATIPIKEGERVDAFITVTKPKPTIWSGPHRITKQDWWSKANAANTALCLCKTDWIAFCDDRCVLSPSWLQAVRDAMEGNYCVVGTYEKHENMIVEKGEIVKYGPLVGEDHRRAIGRDRQPCIGTWLFGCTFALPLEWALQVNGFFEGMDSLGQEDTQFGSMLAANGFDIRLDKRMHVIQDRTPGECGPEMKRTSKERFQNDVQDRGHEAIRRFFGKKQASHVWNIREMRASVQSGNPFPNTDAFPRNDWWDGAPIAEFE